MSITYNPIAIRGVATEPIIEEVLFENNTINKSLVTFDDDVKAETIYTEASATATMQEFTCGVPTASGDLSSFDAIVTPTKVRFYTEFCPDKLRFSRYKRDMSPSAWNDFSNEFERLVIGGAYANQISLSAERNFWIGATSATLSSIAALTPGSANTSISAEEQLIAASALGVDGQFDGLITKVLYNDSRASGVAGLGERLKVVGTTITSANIKTESDKVYEAIPSEVLENGEMPTMYAPYKHRQLIATYNNNVANFKDAFLVDGDTYTFNGVKIVFVPIPENVILCARKSHLFWVTDLISDINEIKVDYIANNRRDWFLDAIMSIGAHVANQKFNVLYVG